MPAALSFIRASAPSGEFEPFPIDRAQVLEGAPNATVRWLHVSAPGTPVYYAGLWTCQPSRFTWTFDANETAHLLEGRIRVTDDGGTSRELGPGDVAFFPRGAVTTWHVIEPMKKLFVDA
ncbi:MAG: DUF861 domain-containing protein [Gemmatimonadetes bacterium]|nr:DUF861 domain-containing protein [Gemmatimonadota bacterium]